LQTRFSHNAFFIGACLTVCMLATAACGSVAPKALTAEQIAQKVNQANIKDAGFDLNLNITAGGTTLTFTGNGKFTQSPARSELTLKGNFLGTDTTIDDITADGYDYTKTTPSTTTKYVKAPIGADSTIGIGGSSINTIADLNSPTLVGIETINGAPAYHLRGTVTTPTPEANASTPSGPATEDLWVKTSNFYPVKAALSSDSTTAGQKTTTLITVTFTSWNTGITINVPPPSDIEG
jgi:hypothetical protein